MGAGRHLRGHEVLHPIFYSHADNVYLQLDNEYKGDGGRFVVAMQKTPAGEFQGSWIWISDWAEFSTTVGRMVGLYTKYKKEIDKILAGDLSVQEGLLEKTDRKSYREAKAIVTNDISNADIFLKVVTEGRGNNEFAESDATAVKKIIDLAFTK